MKKSNDFKKAFDAVRETLDKILDLEEKIPNSSKIDQNDNFQFFEKDLQEKDPEEIKKIINKNPEILSVVFNEGRENLLIWAIKNKKIDLAKIFLDIGISPNSIAKIEDRTTYRPDSDGFDTHPESKQYGSALFYAADVGSVEMVDLLISKGTNTEIVNSAKATALHMAARHGRLEIVKKLVKAGAKLDVVDSLGNSALLYAINNRHTKTAKYLIKAGADINIKNRKLNTAIHAAAFNGELEILDILIDKKCDIDAVNDKGETAIYISIVDMTMTFFNTYKTYYKMIESLLKAGAKVDILQKEDGSTALIKAVKYAHIPVVEMLTQKNADINMTIDDGSNALILAARLSPRTGYVHNNYMSIAKKLIIKGAFINERDCHGKTALYYACSKGNIELAELLLNNNANPNICGFNNESPLTTAILLQNSRLVRLLLKKGADIKHQIKDGESLIEFAKNNSSNYEIVNILREWKITERHKSAKNKKLSQKREFDKMSKRQQSLRKLAPRNRNRFNR